MHHAIKPAMLLLTAVVFFLSIDNSIAAQASTTNTIFDSAKAVKEIAAQSDAFIIALSKPDSVALGNVYTKELNKAAKLKPVIHV